MKKSFVLYRFGAASQTFPVIDRCHCLFSLFAKVLSEMPQSAMQDRILKSITRILIKRF
jgi:hypothetical protein